LVSARFFELLAHGQTGHIVVDEFATAMQYLDLQVVANGAISMIRDWAARGILLKQQA
jgi:hypothetical protein